MIRVSLHNRSVERFLLSSIEIILEHSRNKSTESLATFYDFEIVFVVIFKLSSFVAEFRNNHEICINNEGNVSVYTDKLRV